MDCKGTNIFLIWTFYNACLQAQENIAASPFISQIKIFHSALQNFQSNCFDCIVTNPPFFENSLSSPDPKRDIARHSTSLPFSALFEGVDRLLIDKGVFSAVIPVEAEDGFSSEAYLKGLRPHRRTLIKTTPRKPPKRLLLAFSKGSLPPVDGETFNEIQTLFTAEGKRTEWYQKITAEFYII